MSQPGGLWFSVDVGQEWQKEQKEQERTGQRDAKDGGLGLDQEQGGAFQ